MLAALAGTLHSRKPKLIPFPPTAHVQWNVCCKVTPTWVSADILPASSRNTNQPVAGRGLGTALLSSLSFCSFIFHSSCQESIFIQKFLLCSPCPPLLSFQFPPPLPGSNCIFTRASCCFLFLYILTLLVSFISTLSSLIFKSLASSHNVYKLSTTHEMGE